MTQNHIERPNPRRNARRMLACAVGLAVASAALPASAALQSFTIDPGRYQYPVGGDNGGSTIGATAPADTSPVGGNTVQHGTVLSNDTALGERPFFHDLIVDSQGASLLDANIVWASGGSWPNWNTHTYNQYGTGTEQNGSNGFAVAFDTHASYTEDGDLEDPFKNPATGLDWGYSGTGSNVDADLRRPGHVITVQERNQYASTLIADCTGSDGRCNDDGIANNNVGPDDDAAGQWLWFEFSMPVTLTDAAFFDLDAGYQSEFAFVSFYDENGGQIGATETISGFGNRSAIRWAFGDGAGTGSGVEGVSQMLVDFTSSGAIDQINGFKDIPTPPNNAIPAPTTLGLLGLGLVALRRRRSI
ncbi:MAG: PEP-CTERM sorting domain-containing protein [Ectothiorhodospiraceae bacterium]|nr:PEP-CTERM sorting domain-containing protein [Ectothiorhodospiraceae bacterium]